jgi:prevent-host-death family protein
MAREIPVTQARADLADLVSRVGYSGERILLTRHGRPLAALVPVADLEALERPLSEVGFMLSPATDPAADPAPPARGGTPARETPARETPGHQGPMRIAAELRDPDDRGRRY